MNRRILIPVTFREFNGGFDAKIQEEWLARLHKQTYQNYLLVVTSFKEKFVKKALEDSGVKYLFYQSDRQCLFSITDMIDNTIANINPGNDIVLWTTSDHMFDEDFFQILNDNFHPGEGGTSYPHPEYYGIEDFAAGKMTDEYYDEPITSPFQLDPNLHLPEVFYLDGDLFLDKTNKYFMDKYPVHGLFPGIGLTLYIAMLSKNLKNLIFLTKIHKVTNNKKINQPSKQNPEQFDHYWNVIRNMCIEKGTPKSMVDGGILFTRKWRMHLQYSPVGNIFQKTYYYFYFMKFALFPRRDFLPFSILKRIMRKLKQIKLSYS